MKFENILENKDVFISLFRKNRTLEQTIKKNSSIIGELFDKIFTLAVTFLFFFTFYNIGTLIYSIFNNDFGIFLGIFIGAFICAFGSFYFEDEFQRNNFLYKKYFTNKNSFFKKIYHSFFRKNSYKYAYCSKDKLEKAFDDFELELSDNEINFIEKYGFFNIEDISVEDIVDYFKKNKTKSLDNKDFILELLNALSDIYENEEGYKKTFDRIQRLKTDILLAIEMQNSNNKLETINTGKAVVKSL